MWSSNYVYLITHTVGLYGPLLYAQTIVNALLQILPPTNKLNTCRLTFKTELSLHRPFQLLAESVYHAHGVPSSCTQVYTHTHTSTLARILSSEPCPLGLSHTRARTHKHSVYKGLGPCILSLSLYSDTTAQTHTTTISTHQSKCRQITTDAGRW